MIVFAMAFSNTCDHKVTESPTKKPSAKAEKLGSEGESLNKCSGVYLLFNTFPIAFY